MTQRGLSWFIKFVVGITLLCLLLGASSAPVAAQPVAPSATLMAIRAAHHAETIPAYDRVVFQINGRLPDTISIQYVPRLIADASGHVLPITGKGILQLRLSPASAHTSVGQPTVPARIHSSLPLVKEIVRSGDFEAVVSYGIGVSQKTEYRVFTLTNPTRVVIDFLQ
jgi:hypothetical protein